MRPFFLALLLLSFLGGTALGAGTEPQVGADDLDVRGPETTVATGTPITLDVYLSGFALAKIIAWGELDHGRVKLLGKTQRTGEHTSIDLQTPPNMNGPWRIVVLVLDGKAQLLGLDIFGVAVAPHIYTIDERTVYDGVFDFDAPTFYEAPEEYRPPAYGPFGPTLPQFNEEPSDGD